MSHADLASAGGNEFYQADIVNIGRPESDKDEESKDTTALKPSPRSLPWAMLLRRVFAIDVLKCDSCGGTMKILAIVPASDAEEALKQALPQPSDVQPHGSELLNSDPAAIQKPHFVHPKLQSDSMAPL